MNVRRMPRRRGRRRSARARRVLDVALALAILGLIALVAARLDRVATRQLSGTATVNDGDTLTLNDERIRLRGIDAPELTQRCRLDGANYACGREAQRALSTLVAGRTVACSGWERDRYGRLLARCSTGEQDLGQALVDAGWAVAYGDYHLAEAGARMAGRGLWAGTFDRPRDWRASHGAAAGREHAWLGRALNWLRQIVWRPADSG